MTHLHMGPGVEHPCCYRDHDAVVAHRPEVVPPAIQGSKPAGFSLVSEPSRRCAVFGVQQMMGAEGVSLAEVEPEAVHKRLYQKAVRKRLTRKQYAQEAGQRAQKTVAAVAAKHHHQHHSRRNKTALGSLDAGKGAVGEVKGHQQIFQVTPHQHVVSCFYGHVCNPARKDHSMLSRTSRSLHKHTSCHQGRP